MACVVRRCHKFYGKGFPLSLAICCKIPSQWQTFSIKLPREQITQKKTKMFGF